MTLAWQAMMSDMRFRISIDSTPSKERFFFMEIHVLVSHSITDPLKSYQDAQSHMNKPSKIMRLKKTHSPCALTQELKYHMEIELRGRHNLLQFHELTGGVGLRNRSRAADHC